MKRLIATLAAGALALCGAVPAVAQDPPPPFQDFTFKRVGVPKPGSGPRIRVQISEDAERTVRASSAETPTPSASDGTAGSDAYAWFWAEISPTLSASGPGRLDLALRHLANGRVATPRLDALRSILDRHQSDILLASVGTRVSPALVLATISVESSGRADAVSQAGATGLMQLMPDTAARFGVDDIADPAQNIKGGVAFLDWLMTEFDADPILVLAAYNAGEGAVRRYEGVPPFAETRGYVPKVLAAWSVARTLCATPPELMSDGCAFHLPGS